MRLRRTAAVTALTVAALIASTLPALSAPATAQTRTVQDPSNDVVILDPDSPHVGSQHPDPLRTNGDLTSMTLRHGVHRVRLRLNYTALTLEPDSIQFHGVRLRTGHRNYEVSLFADPEHPQGQRLFRRGNRILRCHGITSSIDYTDATVRFSVPRRCLGSPQWVRAGAGAGVLTGNQMYADDVSLDGRVRDDLFLGPRVRRG